MVRVMEVMRRASAGLPNPSSYTVDDVNDVVLDNVTGLTWQRTVDGSAYTWAGAGTYCDNLDLGGYSDWRLPTRIELGSLVDFTVKQPCIDGNAFPNTLSIAFWTFWTSTADAANVGFDAWAIGFDYGRPFQYPLANKYQVRCVR